MSGGTGRVTWSGVDKARNGRLSWNSYRLPASGASVLAAVPTSPLPSRFALAALVRVRSLNNGWFSSCSLKPAAPDNATESDFRRGEHKGDGLERELLLRVCNKP